MYKKTGLVVSAALFLIIAMLPVSTKAADPGHIASAISAGTFESGDFSFPGNLTVGSSVLFIDSSSGRAGLGTPSPNNTLTVVGDINATANISTVLFCLNGSCRSSWPVGSVSSAWLNGSSWTYLNSSFNPDLNITGILYVKSSSGRVGIGNNNPDQTLTINQSSDSSGIKLRGYDDVSSYFGSLYLDSSGHLHIDSSSDSGSGGALYFDADDWVHFSRRSQFYENLLMRDDQEFQFGDQQDFSAGYNSADGTWRLARGANLGDPILIAGKSAQNVTFKVRAEGSQEENIQEWLDSSNNILAVVDENGSVGIGTGSPMYKLDVGELGNSSGKLKIQSNVEGDVSLFEDTDIENDDEGRYLYIHRKAQEGDAYSKQGFTAAPAFRYLVSGAHARFQVDDNRYIWLDSGEDIYMDLGDASGSDKILIRNNTPSTVSWMDSSGGAYFSGSIGIGTENPGSSLTVAGDINATANISTTTICLDGDCKTIWPSLTDTNSWINSSSWTYLNETYNQDVNISGLLYVNASSGRLGVGTESPQEMMDVNTSAVGTGAIIGNAFVGVWNGDDVYAVFSHKDFRKTTNNYAFIQNEYGETWFNAANGRGVNFNIGANKKMRLHSSGGFSIGDVYDDIDPGEDNVIIEGKLGLGTNTTSEHLTVNGSLLIENSSGSGIFIVDAGTERLGVGTDSPQTEFHLRGDTGSTTMRFEQTQGSGSAWDLQSSSDGDLYWKVGASTKLRLREVGSFHTYRYNNAPGNIAINMEGDGEQAGFRIDTEGTVHLDSHNGSSWRVIQSWATDGKVGIGTENPGNSLTVVGDINATGNISAPVLCLDGDCQASWPSASAGAWSNDSGNTWTYHSVGVGTGSPSAMLEVNGSFRVTDPSNNNVLLYVNQTTGYTGIGKTNPEYELDLSGDIAAQDVVVSGNITSPDDSGWGIFNNGSCIVIGNLSYVSEC